MNARDLSTFELDRDLFGRLADRFPDDAIRVAESAVLSAGDVATTAPPAPTWCSWARRSSRATRSPTSRAFLAV